MALCPAARAGAAGHAAGTLRAPHCVAGQALLEAIEGLPAPGRDLRGEPGVVHRDVGVAAADELDQALVGADQRVGHHPRAQVIRSWSRRPR